MARHYSRSAGLLSAVCYALKHMFYLFLYQHFDLKTILLLKLYLIRFRILLTIFYSKFFRYLSLYNFKRK